MNEYFVVDPESVRDHNELRFLLDNFGFTVGRFICQYPEDWRKRISILLDRLDGLERARAFNYLERKLHEIIPISENYCDNEPWITNALDLKRRRCERMELISRYDSPGLIHIEEVIHGNYLDNFKSVAIINETIEEYVRNIRPIFHFCEEVFLLDRFFQLRTIRPDQQVSGRKRRSQYQHTKSSKLGCRLPPELVSAVSTLSEQKLRVLNNRYRPREKNMEFIKRLVLEASRHGRTKRIIVLLKNIDLVDDDSGSDFKELNDHDFNTIRKDIASTGVELRYQVIPGDIVDEKHWRLIFGIKCGIQLDAGIRFSGKKNQLNWLRRQDLQALISGLENFFPKD